MPESERRRRGGHRRCPKANEGAVEGADRRSATATAKPVAHTKILCYTFRMTKPELRKQIKELLSSPAIKTTLASQSREVCNQIISSRLYTSCTTLLAYMPLEDEVDIRPVIEAALKSGKKVFLPRIWPETNSMEFYHYDEKSQTKTGSFGIEEPEPVIKENAHTLEVTNKVTIIKSDAFTFLKNNNEKSVDNPGSMKSVAHKSTKGYISEEEYNRMTRDQIRENFDVITESMSKW